MTRADIEHELARATSLVRAADASVRRREPADIDPLNRLVERACAASRGLPADQARQLLPAMQALIGDLDRLDAALRENARALGGGGGDAARRAGEAYAKGAGGA